MIRQYSHQDPHVHLLPYIVAATFFMEYLDTMVVATALPQMAHSFGVGPNELSLGMTVYMLARTVFIPVSGWIACQTAIDIFHKSACIIASHIFEWPWSARLAKCYQPAEINKKWKIHQAV